MLVIIVDGETAPGFEPMRTALSRVVEALGNAGGAAVAAFVEGRPVVDLWGGSLGPDSLVHTWSAVKPVAGSCLLHLISLDRLSLDDPVVKVWPELSAGEDGRLRIRHLLAHAAGLTTVPGPATGASLLDWNGMVAGLTAAEPDWLPGEGVGEHAFTFGHLVGEVVRRVDGRSLGRYLDDELTGPLGLDIHIGVGDSDLERVADTVGLTEPWWEEQRGPPASLRRRAFPDGVNESLVNSEVWRRGEVPAVNGHATARGLAMFYLRLLEGRLPAGRRPGRRRGLRLGASRAGRMDARRRSSEWTGGWNGRTWRPVGSCSCRHWPRLGLSHDRDGRRRPGRPAGARSPDLYSRPLGAQTGSVHGR